MIYQKGTKDFTFTNYCACTSASLQSKIMNSVTAICVSVLLVLIWTNVEGRYSPEQITQLATYCNSTKADLEVLLKYEVPDTKTGECLMLCMMKALKVVNAKGVFDSTSTLEVLKLYWREFSDEQLQNVTNACDSDVKKYDSAGPDTCAYGHFVMKCINKKFKEKIVRTRRSWRFEDEAHVCRQLFLYAPYTINKNATTVAPTGSPSKAKIQSPSLAKIIPKS